MAAGRGDVAECRHATRMLDGAERNVAEGNGGCDQRRPPVRSNEREHQPNQQCDGDERIDDRDPVPAETVIRERPEQLGAVARGRVEQAMAEVGQESAAPQGEPAGAIAPGGPEEPERRDDGRADRGKEQRVGEPAVVDNGDERIGGAADEDIRIGREGGEPADESGSATELTAAARVGEGGAQKRMGDRIQGPERRWEDGASASRSCWGGLLKRSNSAWPSQTIQSIVTKRTETKPEVTEGEFRRLSNFGATTGRLLAMLRTTLSQMKTLCFSRFPGLVITALILGGAIQAAPAADQGFFGRWALTIPNGRAGWLEIKQEQGWYDGSLLWGGGSVLPVANVVIADGTLTVTRIREIERKNAAGEVIRTQQLTETITGTVEGDTLRLTHIAPRANGKGFERAEFTGRRIPPLPPRPNLAQVKFGAPIQLLNGRDLSGWRLNEPDGKSAWSIENGVLVNRPPEHGPGQPRQRTANLRTERDFEDQRVSLEVNVPSGSNSGVYLRGLYEIQVFDSYGKPLDSHNMGAVYSRITPSVPAEKPAGEWQKLEMTLVDRHMTVVLNGTTIIDNQPLLGCTGGALFSDESRSGPLLLQGDHGAVSYRNIVLWPVVR